MDWPWYPSGKFGLYIRAYPAGGKHTTSTAFRYQRFTHDLNWVILSSIVVATYSHSTWTRRIPMAARSTSRSLFITLMLPKVGRVPRPPA